MNKILILLTLAIIAAIIFLVPPMKGFGDSAKIIFFHVPTAWVSVVAFFASAFYAAKFLRTRDLAFDALSERAARLGFVFVLLSTASGAIFSKLTWGAYWNWDPRQTTIFVLILIYGAYLTLRAAIPNEKIRAKVSAVYSMLSVLTVPFLMFVLPRMYFSLHPSRVEMDSTVLIVLLAALVDATLIFLKLLRR